MPGRILHEIVIYPLPLHQTLEEIQVVLLILANKGPAIVSFRQGFIVISRQLLLVVGGGEAVVLENAVDDGREILTDINIRARVEVGKKGLGPETEFILGIIAHPLDLAKLRDEAVIVSEMILDDNAQGGRA